ncbi:helix-turn-helix domain-containing protein [Terribacillus sp. JSM ZJ617]|uniref:helix-turn-helix domain-containing protein n=1 Tax=Terribacillus sp. JSM ZJ617 TaxID=3342119 RepID=UPI0035A829F5
MQMNDKLITLLKHKTKEKGLSMRALSRQTGIDPAIVSKIMNGKRNATVNHLHKLSESLDVPLEELMTAAGFIESAPIDGQQHLLALCQQADPDFSQGRVEKQLASYEEVALTDGGKQIIDEKFEEKLNAVGSVGKLVQDLKQMYVKFQTGAGSKRELIILGAALLYFINPIDALPDYIFPFGYLDDTLAVHSAMQATNK